MGFTPLFELFFPPCQFCAVVQCIWWDYSSKKSDPWLLRQTGVNRKINTLFLVLQYLRWHNMCVTLDIWWHFWTWSWDDIYIIPGSGSKAPPVWCSIQGLLSSASTSVYTFAPDSIWKIVRRKIPSLSSCVCSRIRNEDPLPYLNHPFAKESKDGNESGAARCKGVNRVITTIASFWHDVKRTSSDVISLQPIISQYQMKHQSNWNRDNTVCLETEYLKMKTTSNRRAS